MMIRFSGAFVLLATALLLGQAAEPPPNTLSKPRTPVMKTASDGFIKRWLLLEPIDDASGLTDNAVKASVHKDYFPDNSP